MGATVASACIRTYINIYIEWKCTHFICYVKRWLGWISLGHAFIHKIWQWYWEVLVNCCSVGLSFDVYWKLFDLLHPRYFLFFHAYYYVGFKSSLELVL